MSLPPFVYSIKFWEGVSYVVAGALVLLVYFGVLNDQWLYGAPVIFAAIKAVLKWFQIELELRNRNLIL